MRWDHCKACNEYLDYENKIIYDRLGELCNDCFKAADIPLPFEPLEFGSEGDSEDE